MTQNTKGFENEIANHNTFVSLSLVRQLAFTYYYNKFHNKVRSLVCAFMKSTANLNVLLAK